MSRLSCGPLSIRKELCAAAVLALLAGTSSALGQAHTYNRGAGTNNWSDAANWNVAPPAGGGVTRSITLANAVVNATRVTNVYNGAGAPPVFTLNQLTFEGG